MNKMTDKEIYEQLKEGQNPSYIDGLRHFDTSEVIQWMISYHQEVNAELLEALQDMLSGWQYIRKQHGDLYGVGLDREEQKAVSAINKALGESC